MNEILFNICITAIITTVLKMLVPSERQSKQIKMLISCFFIVSVMGMLRGNEIFGGFSEILASDTAYNDYSVTFARQTADEAANALREQIKTELLKENIIPEKIYIDINISENSSISFNEIRLVFDDASSELAERAVRITESCVNYEIKVSLEE